MLKGLLNWPMDELPDASQARNTLRKHMKQNRNMLQASAQTAGKATGP